MSEAVEPVGPPVDAEAGKPTGKPTMKERYQTLLAEFGGVAVVTYLTIFAASLLTFATLIKLGVTGAPEGAGAEAGVWFSAWVATKLIQPGRIVATLVLTPIVASAWHKLRPPADPAAAASDEAPEPDQAT